MDHWRTAMLIEALGEDEMTPLYLLRIWAHCQTRRATRFDMPCAGLKALCRYKGDAQKLETALIDAGFIVRDGQAIDVPKWGEHNATLVANWINGAKGGRPPKTQTEPNNNPIVTHAEPIETHAEPIREEKRREEQLPTNPIGLVVAGEPDADAEKASKPSCPHKAIVALYHETLPANPSIRDWTAARAEVLRTRWNEDPSRQSIEYWRKFFVYVSGSPFLTGKRTGKDGRAFTPGLEWLLKAENFAKIREGRYHEETS